MSEGGDEGDDGATVKKLGVQGYRMALLVVLTRIADALEQAVVIMRPPEPRRPGYVRTKRQ